MSKTATRDYHADDLRHSSWPTVEGLIATHRVDLGDGFIRYDFIPTAAFDRRQRLDAAVRWADSLPEFDMRKVLEHQSDPARPKNAFCTGCYCFLDAVRGQFARQSA